MNKNTHDNGKNAPSPLSQIHFIRHGITEGNQKKWFYGRLDIPLADEGVDELIRLASAGIYPCTKNPKTIDSSKIEKSAEHSSAKQTLAPEEKKLQISDICKDMLPDFYTSGMLRTEQTFFLIYGLAKHGVIDDFKELDFGEFEGHTHEELKNNPRYQAWISGFNEDAAPPMGESPRRFKERIMRGYETLMSYHKIKEQECRIIHAQNECDMQENKFTNDSSKECLALASTLSSDNHIADNHIIKEAHSIVVCHGGVISNLMRMLFAEEGKNFYEWLPNPGHGYTLTVEGGIAKKYTPF